MVSEIDNLNLIMNDEVPVPAIPPFPIQSYRMMKESNYKET